MTIDAAWLEENVLLHKLNEGDLSLLNEVFETITYHAGEEIIAQNNTARELHILRSGSAAITQTNGVKCVCLGYADEGALFGSMSFLTEKEASATVTAHSNCLTYKLNLDGYCKLVTQNQELLLSLLTYMLNYSGNIVRMMNKQFSEQA